MFDVRNSNEFIVYVNVVIFNYNKCEVTGSVVYKVEQNSYRCSMQDSSAAWLNMPPILRETSI